MRCRVLFAGLFAVLFFAKPAPAAEFNYTTLGECREYSSDPTFVLRVAVPPGRNCEKGADGARFAQEDTWLGIRLWLNTKGGLLAWEVIEPEEKPEVVDAEKFQVCAVMPPDGSYTTEWFVPAHLPCEARGPISRQYFAGKVCLRPRNVCVDVGQLRPLARQRVHNSIVEVIRKREEQASIRGN